MTKHHIPNQILNQCHYVILLSELFANTQTNKQKKTRAFAFISINVQIYLFVFIVIKLFTTFLLSSARRFASTPVLTTTNGLCPKYQEMYLEIMINVESL